MNHQITQILFQRLPYVFILSLFFCLVPWKHLQLISFEFWVVISVTGLLVFQMIKDNDIIWGIIVGLFSFYCFWMVLAILSDLHKPGDNKDEFLLYAFLIAIFTVNIWLILVNPVRRKRIISSL